MLAGRAKGFVYQRDGHPNAELLAQRCCELHAAPWAVVTASGMSALAAAILSQVSADGHILASNQLYGRSLQLIAREATRANIEATVVDTTDLDAVRTSLRENTQLVVVETITNPLLRLTNIPALAMLLENTTAKLLVDNTFATPLGCRPLELGADLVMESISKMMNGHSDVMLGMLAGKQAPHETGVRDVVSVWGLNSSPFDCWLATRGLSTLHLRFRQACQNAQKVAEYLENCEQVQTVHYPGLISHPDYQLAGRILAGYGWMVTFDLAIQDGGSELAVAEKFIAATDIPFCPSLGEVDTTLSHPASTSHRGLSATEQAALGIHGGTIRLSVGTEATDTVLEMLVSGLARL